MSSGFRIFRRDRLNSINYGGGVLIAVKTEHPASIVDISNLHNIEIICVRVHLNGNNLFIVLTYMPPSSPQDRYVALISCLHSITTKMKDNDRIILLGDFNLPSLAWSLDLEINSMIPSSGNETSINYIQDLSTLGLKQINTITNNKSKLLDLIFVDDSNETSVKRCPPLVSPEDVFHPTLELSMNYSSNNNKSKFPVSKRLLNFNKTNLPKLIRMISSTNWDIFFPKRVNSPEELNSVIHKFNVLLLDYINRCVPRTKILDPPIALWHNKRLHALRNKKSRLYKKYKKSLLIFDYSSYLITRYQYQCLCKQAYSSYLNKISHNLKRNPKYFWKFIKHKRNDSISTPLLKFDEDTTNDVKVQCGFFAKFFQSVYNSEPYPSQSYVHPLRQFQISQPIISIDIVEKFASNLTPTTSCGPDGIPAFIIKHCCTSLAQPLFKLFTFSMSAGYFPTYWKISYIIPLHKSGSKLDVKNYRGIAKLSAIPKLFESILASQISLDIQRIISPLQHGFVSKRSTSTNLSECMNIILHQFKSKVQTDIIYTDFSKAFDSVNLELMMIKLEMYGFPTLLLNWLRSYMFDRCQQVLYNSVKSSPFIATSGVPQGSHLGPLLFNLYINDLPEVIKSSYTLMFADDVKIIHPLLDGHDKLQTDLDNLVNWSYVNRLPLNVKKCKCMSFTRSSAVTHPYTINGGDLERVMSFQDLGVIMDPKLSFNSHIDSIINKASIVLGCIKRWAKEFSDPYVTKLLYVSLVRPILEYVPIVWSPSYLTHINRIESVQKQFLIFCLRNLGWDPTKRLPPYEQRLKLLALHTLSSRRQMLNVCFVHRILIGDVDCPSLLSKLHMNVPVRFTRQPAFLSIKRYNQNYLNNFAFIVAQVDYNHLCEFIDFDRPLSTIKHNVLTFLNK